MAKLLRQFSRRLNPEQVAAGMNAAVRNARRLAEDARALLDRRSFASAVSLAALSIEESGKTSILRSISLARSDDEAKQGWKEYRSHRSKNATWVMPELVSKGARHLDDFRSLFDRQSDHPLVLDKVKQVGFYTDCIGDGRWIEPTNVIEEPLAQGLVRIAELFAQNKETTTREIELWVYHVGPVWRKDMSWMKKAVSNWNRAMREEGLLPADSASMDDFLWPSGSPDKNRG